MYRSLAIFSLVLASGIVAGCSSSDSGGVGDDSSEAVSAIDLARAKVVETTRFRHQGHASGSQDGTRVLSYRFNGFGQTKVKITVTPKNGAFAPTLVLAGPMPGGENTVVTQKRGTKDGGVTLETTLDARGAYRFVVGHSRAFAGLTGDAGDFDVDFACEANCDLPEVTLGYVLRDLKSQLGEADVQAGIAKILGDRVSDPDLRQKMQSALLDLLASGADDAGAAPVLPMSLLGIAQGLFEQPPSSDAPAAAPAPVNVELSAIGRDCKVDRSGPEQASQILPGLSIAENPDYAYDDCSLARMQGLADALNGLSLDDGSRVTDGGKTYTTVGDLVQALQASGHTITLDNMRFFADFLGLDYKGSSVRAPVWMDTGIPVPGGGTLTEPAPHAHHNVYVHGPMFDGQLKFYMGVDGGTSFRAQSTIPRGWSGGRAAYTIEDPSDVVKVMSTAGALRKKWQAAGAALPMQGYGQLGVCTDSTAILEYTLKGTVTLFPLVHPKVTSQADAIDATLAKLPSDLAGFDPSDALRRISATIPFDDVDAVPFQAFKDQWAKVAPSAAPSSSN